MVDFYPGLAVCRLSEVVSLYSIIDMQNFNIVKHQIIYLKMASDHFSLTQKSSPDSSKVGCAPLPIYPRIASVYYNWFV